MHNKPLRNINNVEYTFYLMLRQSQRYGQVQEGGTIHRLHHLLGEVLRLCCIKNTCDGRCSHSWKIQSVTSFFCSLQSYVKIMQVDFYFQTLYFSDLGFLSFIVSMSLLRFFIFSLSVIILLYILECIYNSCFKVDIC